MARKRKAVEAPNAILSARQDSDDDLAAYCPDLDQGPKSWRVEDRDLLPGQQLVEFFKPFLRHLLSLDLSPKTRRKHRDNLWLLGGELSLDLHEAPRLRKRPMDQLVLEALDDHDGPLISHRASEHQQRSFDATCRKFRRFLKQRNTATP